MAIDELAQSGGGAGERRRAQWIGVYIAVLAVLLAICSMGGNNASKDAAKANLDATNLWAFFQAKNLRRTHYKMWSEELERQLAGQTDLPDEQRRKIERDLAAYKASIAKFTSDKQRKEGLDELWVRAKDLEKVRDDALMRDPFFDYGLAFLQIAIVLASVAIVTGGGLAIGLSVIVGAAGAIFMINGFLMLDQLTSVLSRIMALAGG